jgi:hypothetical protein
MVDINAAGAKPEITATGKLLDYADCTCLTAEDKAVIDKAYDQICAVLYSDVCRGGSSCLMVALFKWHAGKIYRLAQKQDD